MNHHSIFFLFYTFPMELRHFSALCMRCAAARSRWSITNWTNTVCSLNPNAQRCILFICRDLFLAVLGFSHFFYLLSQIKSSKPALVALHLPEPLFLDIMRTEMYRQIDMVATSKSEQVQSPLQDTQFGICDLTEDDVTTPLVFWHLCISRTFCIVHDENKQW